MKVDKVKLFAGLDKAGMTQEQASKKGKDQPLHHERGIQRQKL